MVGHRVIETSLGPLTLAGEADGTLTGVYFDGHRPAPHADALGPPAPDESFARAERELREYLAGERTTSSCPVRIVGGTPLRRAVWAAIAEIGHGETRTYAELAAAVGTHPRAVGGAVGANPLSIVVPCHRVVGSGGALTGYAGGVARKRTLLELEGARLGLPV